MFTCTTRAYLVYTNRFFISLQSAQVTQRPLSPIIASPTLSDEREDVKKDSVGKEAIEETSTTPETLPSLKVESEIVKSPPRKTSVGSVKSPPPPPPSTSKSKSPSPEKISEVKIEPEIKSIDIKIEDTDDKKVKFQIEDDKTKDAEKIDENKEESNLIEEKDESKIDTADSKDVIEAAKAEEKLAVEVETSEEIQLSVTAPPVTPRSDFYGAGGSGRSKLSGKIRTGWI